MIRRPRRDEAGAMREIALAAYQHGIPKIGRPPPPRLDDYAARIAAGQAWVLEDAGEVVGVLVLENGPGTFMLENIAVRPDRQGMGFGRRLLDFAEAEASRCGRDEITLNSHVLMLRNIAIYKARGYKECAWRMGNGMSRVYMTKRFSPST
jgi:ribosomal protein S18 acetylase RimI-like enzyme